MAAKIARSTLREACDAWLTGWKPTGVSWLGSFAFNQQTPEEAPASSDLSAAFLTWDVEATKVEGYLDPAAAPTGPGTLRCTIYVAAGAGPAPFDGVAQQIAELIESEPNESVSFSASSTRSGFGKYDGPWGVVSYDFSLFLTGA